MTIPDWLSPVLQLIAAHEDRPRPYIEYPVGQPPPIIAPRLHVRFFLCRECERCGDPYYIDVFGELQKQLNPRLNRQICYSCAGECSAAAQSHWNLAIETEAEKGEA